MRWVGCWPWRLGTKGGTGSWRPGAGDPGTAMNSPPLLVCHEVPFEEKSGMDADDCAAAPMAASVVQAKASEALPARNFSVNANLAIPPSPVKEPNSYHEKADLRRSC